MIKFNHSADWHFKPARAQELFASIDTLEKNSDNVDFNIVSGDLWDYPVQNTGASQFPGYIKRVSRLAQKCPLIMLQGTPTHDSDGSLDIFAEASSNVTVLELGKAYLATKDKIIELSIGESYLGHELKEDKALIFGIPEPQKKHLIAADTTVTMQQALRTILMGYAAIRQKYADLPCILVYHGPVVGAKNPNGEEVQDGLSADDLALVGADYIALGHIHKPQRVGISRGLNAYYAGAAYPSSDWKDAGYQFGFNQVTLDGKKSGSLIDFFSPSITRIPFPHPLYTKVKTTYPDDIPSGNVMNGSCVWWEISATKEQRATIDTDAMTEELIKLGAVTGSKTTTKPIADETVRAGEITTLRKLRDKFTLWMRNTGKEPTEAQLEKCDVLETELSGTGYAVNGGVFSFDKMILRGSKGIWKKQRKDEITVDLTQFDSGIIAFIGPNGNGKSTIMNLFHMWSEMPNHPGPLYKQFRLKDSLKEVYATERNSGIQYRSRIVMDSPAKKAEYYLEQKTGDTWESVDGITGRIADYDKVVNSIFGTLDMYIRTSFQMQTPTDKHPDLSKATQGERKTVMAALAGLDFYATHKDNAKKHHDTEQRKLEDAETQVKTLTSMLEDSDMLKQKKTDAEKRIIELSAELAKCEKDGKDISEILKTLREQASVNDLLVSQKNDLQKNNSDYQEEIHKADKEISELNDVISRESDIVASIKLYDDLSEKEKNLIQERSEQAEKNIVLQSDYQKKLQEYNANINGFYDREKLILKEKDKFLEAQSEKQLTYQSELQQYNEAEKKLTEKKAQLDRKYADEKGDLSNKLGMMMHDKQRIEKELAIPVSDHCPTCGQILPPEALEEINSDRERKEAAVKKLSENIEVLKKQFEQLKADYESLENTITDELFNIPEPQKPEITPYDDTKLKELYAEKEKAKQLEPQKPEITPYDDTKLKELYAEKDAIRIEYCRIELEKAKTAKIQIKSLSDKITEAKDHIAENETKITEFEGRISLTIDAEVIAKESDLADARNKYSNINGKLSAAKTDLDYAEKAITKQAEVSKRIAELDDVKCIAEKETADWSVLMAACGQNGIPALELDAVCPSIAAVATELLTAYEDGRYSIRFDTTREGGKGNQIEDFLIQIVDSKDGEEQEFDTLSGGETAWIRKALQDAFGIVRANNSGIRFVTSFLDESDSALFPESRIAYFHMLESAHKQAGRERTVMVTHSPELQEMIQQKIEVTKL